MNRSSSVWKKYNAQRQGRKYCMDVPREVFAEVERMGKAEGAPISKVMAKLLVEAIERRKESAAQVM